MEKATKKLAPILSVAMPSTHALQADSPPGYVPVMNTLRRFDWVRRGSCAAWLAALLLAGSSIGCRPSAGASKQEDQNIRTGKNYLNARLYDEAEKALQRALQNNPNSAEAHWELGTLYFQEREDYISALYHISRFATLRPGENKDPVERITEVCRQEIAKQMPLGSVTRDLRPEISLLERSNATLRAELERLRRSPVAPGTAPSVPRGETQSVTPGRAAVAPDDVNRPSTPPSDAGPARQVPAPLARTHRIRAGETFHSVARDYHLDPQRVIAANPSIDPRTLQVGQVIRLPNP